MPSRRLRRRAKPAEQDVEETVEHEEDEVSVQSGLEPEGEEFEKLTKKRKVSDMAEEAKKACHFFATTLIAARFFEHVQNPIFGRTFTGDHTRSPWQSHDISHVQLANTSDCLRSLVVTRSQVVATASVTSP